MRKLWESFSTFAMSEIESSKERKGHKQIVAMNDETLGKKEVMESQPQEHQLWNVSVLLKKWI